MQHVFIVENQGKLCIHLSRVKDILSPLMTFVWCLSFDHTHTLPHTWLFPLHLVPRCPMSLKILSGIIFDSGRAHALVSYSAKRCQCALREDSCRETGQGEHRGATFLTGPICGILRLAQGFSTLLSSSSVWGN